jgi:membrane protein
MRIDPEALETWFDRVVWETDTHALPPPRAFLVRAARMGSALLREITEGQLTLRAMSLVYTTLLSLVPLLAFSFSVLKGFGVHNQVEPFLLQFLAPLGERGIEISQRIIGFVENIRVGVLGSVGLALLLYTVISLIYKVEQAFNYIWHVGRDRGLVERFSEYLSVLLIGPLLVFSALGFTASLMSSAWMQRLFEVPVLGELAETSGRLVPYLLVVAAFTFAYTFLPNTRVRLLPALAGGLLAGALWETVGWAFGTFVVTSTKYAAIYSGFAILILFMIWLFVSWLILLLGASIAFYLQHPEHLAVRRPGVALSNRLKERLALAALFLVAQHHYHRAPAWSAAGLAERLGVPGTVLAPVLGLLVGRGLLAEARGDPLTFLPAVDPERIALEEALRTIREAEEDGGLRASRVGREAAVEELLERVRAAEREALAGRTLRDLVAAHPPGAQPAANPEAAPRGREADDGDA